jgi:hypothetical protein
VVLSGGGGAGGRVGGCQVHGGKSSFIARWNVVV